MKTKPLLIVAVLLALAASGLIYYTQVMAPAQAKAEAQKRVRGWAQAWDKARTCLLGPYASTMDPRDAIGIRDVEMGKVMVTCKEAVEALEPSVFGTGEYEPAWTALVEQAGNVRIQFLNHMGSANGPAKLGSAIAELDRLFGALASEVGLTDGVVRGGARLATLPTSPLLVDGEAVVFGKRRPEQGRAAIITAKRGAVQGTLVVRGPSALQWYPDHPGVMESQTGRSGIQTSGDGVYRFVEIEVNGSLKGEGREIQLKGKAPVSVSGLIVFGQRLWLIEGSADAATWLWRSEDRGATWTQVGGSGEHYLNGLNYLTGTVYLRSKMLFRVSKSDEEPVPIEGATGSQSECRHARGVWFPDGNGEGQGHLASDQKKVESMNLDMLYAGSQICDEQRLVVANRHREMLSCNRKGCDRLDFRAPLNVMGYPIFAGDGSPVAYPANGLLLVESLPSKKVRAIGRFDSTLALQFVGYAEDGGFALFTDKNGALQIASFSL